MMHRQIIKPSQRIRQRKVRATIVGSEAATQLDARINTLKDLSRYALDVGHDIVAVVRDFGVDNVATVERLQGERGVLLAALKDCHDLISTSLEEGVFSDCDSESEVESLNRQIGILIGADRGGRYISQGALGAILAEADRNNNTRTRY